MSARRAGGETATASGRRVLARAAAMGARAGRDRVAGRYAAAERRFRRAIHVAARSAGEHSVLVAGLRNDLGVTYKHVGRVAEAEALYRQALTVLEGELGPDHDHVATIWHNLAGVAFAGGEFATAETHARRGLAIRIAAAGDDDPAVAADRAALAPIVDALGRHDEAAELLRQALSIYARVHDRYEIAVTLHNLAAVEHRRGRLRRAAALGRHSLRIRARVLGDGHPELGATLVNLAVVQRARGSCGRGAASSGPGSRTGAPLRPPHPRRSPPRIRRRQRRCLIGSTSSQPDAPPRLAAVEGSSGQTSSTVQATDPYEGLDDVGG